MKNNATNSNIISHFGFTLAEILLTLGIIGVVAALTIPTLMQNMGDKATVTSVQKAFSTFSQAYAQAILENGTPDTWNLTAEGSGAGATNVLNILAPYLKIAKNCGVASGCYPDVYYKTLSGGALNYKLDNNSSVAKAQLANGTIISIYVYSPTCENSSGPTLQEICTNIGVDVNGFKGPNQYGKDWFAFYLTKNGIAPFGGPGDTSIYMFSKIYDGSSQGDDGSGATAWVIYNGNMDYTKCFSSLSWTGKTKCD